MNSRRRSITIALSFALCWPLVLDAQRGAVPLGSAALRFGLALLFTGAAIAGLDHLVAGYRDDAPGDRAAVEPGRVPPASEHAANDLERAADRRQPRAPEGTAPA